MMMILGLRNGSKQYRGVMGRAPWFHSVAWHSRTYFARELTGRTVGMIGCGIIGRRLLELLGHFGCDINIHDPYVPRGLGDIYDVTFTSVDQVLEQDVIVCLAPITPATKGMLGREQFARIPDGFCFLNVARADRPERRPHRAAEGWHDHRLPGRLRPRAIPWRFADPEPAERLRHAAHRGCRAVRPGPERDDHGRGAGALLRFPRDPLRPAAPGDRELNGRGAAEARLGSGCSGDRPGQVHGWLPGAAERRTDR